MYGRDVWKWERHSREFFCGRARSKHQEHRAPIKDEHFVPFPRSAQHRPCLPVTLTIGITVYILTRTAVKTTMVRFISISCSFSVSQKKQHRNRQRSAVRVATFEHFYSSIHTIVDFFQCRLKYLPTFFAGFCAHTARCVYIFLTMKRRITPLFSSSI